MALIEPVVVLALFAGLCFATQGYVVEYRLKRAEQEDTSSPAFMAAVVSVAVSVVVFWILAAFRGIDSALLTPVRLAPFIVTGVLYPAAFRLLYYEGIDRVSPSIAAAIVTTNPALAAVLAVFLLDERLTVINAAGLICIVGGGVLLKVAQNAADDGSGSDDVLTRRLANANMHDFAYPIGAATAVGVGYVLIEFGLERFPDTVTATVTTQTAAFVVFAGILAASTVRRIGTAATIRIRPVLAAFRLSSLLVVLAWLGQFFALPTGTIVTVLPLVYVYPLLIVAVSYMQVRELPRSPRVLGGIVAIIAGVILVQIA